MAASTITVSKQYAVGVFSFMVESRRFRRCFAVQKVVLPDVVAAGGLKYNALAALLYGVLVYLVVVACCKRDLMWGVLDDLIVVGVC